MSDQNPPKVSIVIPAYNEEKYIEDCVRSIQKQEVKFLYEIIVVDNASVDNTGAIAKELGARVVKEEQRGLAYARQAGLDAAKGELLVYLDADTRLTSGWLKRMVEYMDSHHNVVALSCKSHLYDGQLLDTIGNELFYAILMPMALFVLRILGKPDILIGFAMVIRTKVLRTVGIDKNFVFYGEDSMIAHRLSSQGKIKFLLNVHVNSSARRYKKQGSFSTIFLYWKTFLLIQLGRIKEAEKFSQKHSSSS